MRLKRAKAQFCLECARARNTSPKSYTGNLIFNAEVSEGSKLPSFETGSRDVAQADQNAPSSCLNLLKSGVTGVSHHIQLEGGF